MSASNINLSNYLLFYFLLLHFLTFLLLFLNPLILLDSTIKLDGKHCDLLLDVDRFWQLVGKLGFFTFTCLNITDDISIVSQCVLLVNLPMQLFVVSCITLRILLNEDYCWLSKKKKEKKKKEKRGLLLILYLWHDLVMEIGMIVILIDNPPLTIITLLEIILLFSIVKGKMLLLSAKI